MCIFVLYLHLLYRTYMYILQTYMIYFTQIFLSFLIHQSVISFGFFFIYIFHVLLRENSSKIFFIKRPTSTFKNIAFALHYAQHTFNPINVIFFYLALIISFFPTKRELIEFLFLKLRINWNFQPKRRIACASRVLRIGNSNYVLQIDFWIFVSQYTYIR